MKREICYRLFRILFVILIFFTFTYLRYDVKGNYDEAYRMQDYLINSLQIKEISNPISREGEFPNSDDEGSLNDGYVLEVSNSSFKERDVTFLLENTISKDESIDNKYVRFQILCNDEVIKTSTVSDDGVLYKTILFPGDKKIYEIKFWIEEGSYDAVVGKKFSAKMILI